MPKTIQELREDRGESRADLAAATGAALHEVTAWELGQAEPGVFHLRRLAEHFGVRDDQINLEPNRPPTLGEQLRDALTD
jgi:transcriptional regulator with XRE-family HTH domain